MSEGGTVKHDGVTSGYLYTVADEIGPDDVHPHPHPVNATRWEWLTNRELKLKLIEQTIVTDEERLTDQEITEMKRKQGGKGRADFRGGICLIKNADWENDARLTSDTAASQLYFAAVYPQSGGETSLRSHAHIGDIDVFRDVCFSVIIWIEVRE